MSIYFNFDKTVKLIIGIAIFLFSLWLISDLKDVLLPFFVACLLSYILNPLVVFNKNSLNLKTRIAAVFITLFDVMIIASLLVYLFMPIVVHEINQLTYICKTYGNLSNVLPFRSEHLLDYIINNANLHELIRKFESGDLGSWIDKGTSAISTSLEYIIHTLEWFLTFIYVVFILLDYNKFSNGLPLLIPSKYRKPVLQVVYDIKYYMNKYFRSQLVLAFCAAGFYCIGFSIVKLPMAIIMGLLVGILYMIPYFQYITIIPVIIICFITSLDGNFPFWLKLGECGIVYIVSQGICDYILTPKIMGKSMGLNPAIILLSLSIWGSLLGIIGMIIAIPLTTLLLVYYKKIIIQHKSLSSPTLDN